VGFCGIFEHFPRFEFSLLPSIVHARPHAGNANRLGGWFNRSILHNSDMSDVKEHMLTHSILPKKEERF